LSSTDWTCTNSVPPAPSHKQHAHKHTLTTQRDTRADHHLNFETHGMT
jgi:hypothetical protein